MSTITLTPSTTSWTNENVSIAAEFDGFAEDAVKEFKLGEDGEWQSYSGECIVDTNTTVFFRAVDSEGGIVENSLIISNIDKTIPVSAAEPQISIDNYVVKISWQAGSDNEAVKGYKLDIDGTVTDLGNVLTTTKTLTAGTHSWKIGTYDAAGNVVWTEAKSFDIADTTAPTVSPSATVTNETIKISWSGNDNVEITKYKLFWNDQIIELSGEIKEYSFSDLANGDYVYRLQAFDAAGNEVISDWEKVSVTQGATGTQETQSLHVTTSHDVVNAYDGKTSLREAVAYAGTLEGGQTITFADNMAELHLLSDITISNQEITFPNNPLITGHNIVISGNVELTGNINFGIKFNSGTLDNFTGEINVVSGGSGYGITGSYGTRNITNSTGDISVEAVDTAYGINNYYCSTTTCGVRSTKLMLDNSILNLNIISSDDTAYGVRVFTEESSYSSYYFSYNYCAYLREDYGSAISQLSADNLRGHLTINAYKNAYGIYNYAKGYYGNRAYSNVGDFGWQSASKSSAEIVLGEITADFNITGNETVYGIYNKVDVSNAQYGQGNASTVIKSIQSDIVVTSNAGRATGAFSSGKLNAGYEDVVVKEAEYDKEGNLVSAAVIEKQDQAVYISGNINITGKTYASGIETEGAMYIGDIDGKLTVDAAKDAIGLSGYHISSSYGISPNVSIITNTSVSDIKVTSSEGSAYGIRSLAETTGQTFGGGWGSTYTHYDHSTSLINLKKFNGTLSVTGTSQAYGFLSCADAIGNATSKITAEYIAGNISVTAMTSAAGIAAEILDGFHAHTSIELKTLTASFNVSANVAFGLKGLAKGIGSHSTGYIYNSGNQYDYGNGNSNLIIDVFTGHLTVTGKNTAYGIYSYAEGSGQSSSPSSKISIASLAGDISVLTTNGAAFGIYNDSKIQNKSTKGTSDIIIGKITDNLSVVSETDKAVGIYSAGKITGGNEKVTTKEAEYDEEGNLISEAVTETRTKNMVLDGTIDVNGATTAHGILAGGTANIELNGELWVNGGSAAYGIYGSNTQLAIKSNAIFSVTAGENGNVFGIHGSTLTINGLAGQLGFSSIGTGNVTALSSGNIYLTDFSGEINSKADGKGKAVGITCNGGNIINASGNIIVNSQGEGYGISGSSGSLTLKDGISSIDVTATSTAAGIYRVDSAVASNHMATTTFSAILKIEDELNWNIDSSSDDAYGIINSFSSTGRSVHTAGSPGYYSPVDYYHYEYYGSATTTTQFSNLKGHITVAGADNAYGIYSYAKGYFGNKPTSGTWYRDYYFSSYSTSKIIAEAISADFTVSGGKSAYGIYNEAQAQYTGYGAATSLISVGNITGTIAVIAEDGNAVGIYSSGDINGGTEKVTTKEAEYDEEGNLISEAVTETRTKNMILDGSVIADGKTATGIEAKNSLNISINGVLASGEFASAGNLDNLTLLNDQLTDFSIEQWYAEDLISASANAFAIKSGNGNDYISIGDGAVVLGNISLGGGNNTLSVSSSSQIYGNIASSGSLNIEFEITSNLNEGAIISTNTAGALANANTNYTINIDSNSKSWRYILASADDLSALADKVFTINYQDNVYQVSAADTFEDNPLVDINIVDGKELELILTNTFFVYSHNMKNDVVGKQNNGTISLTLSQEIDKKSFSLDLVSLVDRKGNKISITDYEINKNILTLNYTPLSSEGSYTLCLSDKIKNTNGIYLDQNLNQKNGESDDFYTQSFIADFTAPKVVKVTPDTDFAGTLSQVQITFSSSVDFNSVKGQIYVISPDGTNISPIAYKQLTPNCIEVIIPEQTAYGKYQLMVGNEIADIAGNKLDQNGDGHFGTTEDVFSNEFNITCIDLKVANVEVSKDSYASGDKITVNWDVYNNGGYALSGSWTDGIYLSTDNRWDINDIKLGELVHDGGLAKDQQLANTIDVALAGVAPGNYYILVRSDIYMQEKADREAAELAQNLVAVPITVTVPSLEIDKTIASSLLENGDFDYYVIHQKANESLNIALDALVDRTTLEMFVGYESAPDRENFDLSLRNITDGEIFVQATSADRDIYIMVNAKNIANVVNYNLTAKSVDLSITSITPTIHGSSSKATFDIIGIDFNPVCTVKFVDQNGISYTPEYISYVNTNHLKVEFAANTLAPGEKYDIVVSDTKESTSLNDAVTISHSSGARFSYGISNIPHFLSNAQTFTFNFSYSNVGVDTMAAPLVALSAKIDGKEGAKFTLDSNDVSRGFWTSSEAEGFSSSIQFLATGSTPGVLQPLAGSSGVSVPIYYAGWNGNTNGKQIEYYASVITADDTTPLNWNDEVSELSLPQAYKDILAANLNVAIGDTWGEYVTIINQNLDYLDRTVGISASGSEQQEAVSIDDMFQFELKQNNGMLSPFRTLLTNTDISTATPNICLEIVRTYNTDLVSRFTEGSFGYGWNCNWDQKLSFDASGNLTFIQGANARLYQPNHDRGYQTVVYDGSVMTKTSSGYKLSEADGTVYLFDNKGLLLSITAVDGNKISCSYTNDKLTSLTHSCGEKLIFTRNDAGYITSVSDTHGNNTSYSYDSNGNLTGVSDSASGTNVSYQYGNTHNITKFTDIDGNSAVFTYDDKNFLNSIGTHNNQYKVSIIYGENGEVTLKDTLNTNQTYYFIDNGLVAKITDNTNGVSTYFRYDRNDNLISAYDSTGKAAAFSYDVKGYISGITDILGNKTSFVNNANGTVSRMTDVHGNVTEYTYDKKANLTETYYADGTCETYTYDNAGNVLTATDVKGGVTTYKYDAQGRVTSTVYNGKTTTYRYDGDSNLSGITYADGTTSTYAYNGLDLMTKFTDAKSNVTTYSYDNAGNMTGITYADNSTESFAYNTAGDLTQWTNRRGGTVNYTVNALGDTTKITQSDGTVINYAYDNQGRVISAGNQEYTYNNLDYVTQVSFSDNREINYTYDNLDRVITISDELGHVTNYTYTQYGEIDTMTNEKGKLVVDYDYDRFGRLAKVSNGNGTYSTYSYNDYDEVTAIEHYSKDGTLTGFNRYTYNTDNLVATKETSEGTWSYSYDKVGQLTSAVLKDTSNNVLRSENYTYDAMGNRTKSVIDGVTTTYTYNNMNQIVSANGFAYKYDADGNLLEDEKRSYTWTTDNRVASETDKATGQTWTYTYDALGNRISSTTNGVTTTYTVDANGNVLAEYVNGKWSRSYYQGNNLAGWTSAEGEYFFNYDILGSTGSITAGNGSIVNSYSYDSFGNITSSTEGIANDFEFVGAYGLMSNASGTTFIRARNYDPVTGRWISIDPIGINGGENLYVYCGNDGVNLVDIDGLSIRYADAAWATVGMGASSFGIVGGVVASVFGGMGLPIVAVSAYGLSASFGNFHAAINGVDPVSHGNIYGDVGQHWWGDTGGAIGDTVSLFAPGAKVSTRKVTSANILDALDKGKSISDIITPPLIPNNDNGTFLGSSQYARAWDPNDKLGNEGYGKENFIAPQTMDYTIRFENDPEWATAPARWVRVYDVLDEDFDLDTFEIKSFCLAGNLINVGNGCDSYNKIITISVAGVDVWVDVKINLDRETREISAEFMAIDPTTGTMSMDITKGLLWPNDETGRGDGDIQYSVKVKEGVENGAKLTNVADIYFDFNEVIETPVVEHTVDSVNPLLSTFSAESDGGNQVTFTLGGTDADSGIKGYNIAYSTDGKNFTFFTTVTGSSWTCEIDLQTEYFFKAQAIDNVGNVSDWSEAITVSQNKFTMPENYKEGKFESITWDGSVTDYVFEISRDNFKTYIAIDISSATNDLFFNDPANFMKNGGFADIAGLPAGTYQWRALNVENRNIEASGTITGTTSGADAFVSEVNGKQDIFFAQTSGKWESGYAAQHNGNLVNNWSGTQEQVTLVGKNKIEDIFIGSKDSNILFLTDDSNGDALFLDDIYTNGVTQSRISGIDKIIAGAGDDVIDFTSSRYAYVGTGMEVYGGNGNDTIWMASGENTLFGDVGNDRLIGGANNDVIIGGVGNDHMHGGGGEDIFCFGGNFGTDTIEQLVGGEITLWFESGSENNWNADTLTYTDGTNSVKVSGISADNISLKFGDDSSDLFNELSASGCFDDAASEKIFEDKNKGFLA